MKTHIQPVPLPLRYAPEWLQTVWLLVRYAVKHEAAWRDLISTILRREISYTYEGKRTTDQREYLSKTILHLLQSREIVVPVPITGLMMRYVSIQEQAGIDDLVIHSSLFEDSVRSLFNVRDGVMEDDFCLVANVIYRADPDEKNIIFFLNTANGARLMEFLASTDTQIREYSLMLLHFLLRVYFRVYYEVTRAQLEPQRRVKRPELLYLVSNIFKALQMDTIVDTILVGLSDTDIIVSMLSARCLKLFVYSFNDERVNSVCADRIDPIMLLDIVTSSAADRIQTHCKYHSSHALFLDCHRQMARRSFCVADLALEDNTVDMGPNPRHLLEYGADKILGALEVFRRDVLMAALILLLQKPQTIEQVHLSDSQVALLRTIWASFNESQVYELKKVMVVVNGNILNNSKKLTGMVLKAFLCPPRAPSCPPVYPCDICSVILKNKLCLSDDAYALFGKPPFELDDVERWYVSICFVIATGNTRGWCVSGKKCSVFSPENPIKSSILSALRLAHLVGCVFEALIHSNTSHYYALPIAITGFTASPSSSERLDRINDDTVELEVLPKGVQVMVKQAANRMVPFKYVPSKLEVEEITDELFIRLEESPHLHLITQDALPSLNHLLSLKMLTDSYSLSLTERSRSELAVFHIVLKSHIAYVCQHLVENDVALMLNGISQVAQAQTCFTDAVVSKLERMVRCVDTIDTRWFEDGYLIVVPQIGS